ncbi:MAG: nucleotide exchange factor GrpE [Nanoarchaeota archaeon]|nr:nucleotide exchange factor GrpE [Nanoarchaeota archaeon]
MTKQEAHKKKKLEIGKKDNRIKELTHKTRELTDSLQRLQAEFENYKKRIEREIQDLITYSSQNLIIKLLPIVNSFEIALKNHKDKNKFLEGMKLVFSQFYSTLEKEGLKQIDPLNEKFDPYKHEVIMHEKTDKKENTITEVLQKGYILNDKVIRHAKVKIAKNK